MAGCLGFLGLRNRLLLFFSKELAMRSAVMTSLVFASLSFTLPGAMAQNVLERILMNPRVQALAGKPAEITNALNLCKNPTYQRANAQACQDAANADMAGKLPLEMRMVMSNPQTAKSMRDLCIAAQSTAQRDSYLCTELAKADQSFNAAMQGARAPATGTNLNDLSN
jgi:hypothetical protein